MFFEEDREINVSYYRVKEGTVLHATLADYWNKAEEFCEKAEGLVKKFNAISAIRTHDMFNIHVDKLAFTYDTAPLTGWTRDSFGNYDPSDRKIRKEFENIKLDYFGRNNVVLEGTRFDKVGDTFIAACTPNKDGSIPYMDGAYLLTQDEVQAIKPIEQLQLNRTGWTVAPLRTSSAFQPSEQVNKENEEWWNEHFGKSPSYAFQWKHSSLGRHVNRWLHNREVAKTTQPS